MIHGTLADNERRRALSLREKGLAALVAGTFLFGMTAPAVADDDDDDGWKRRGEVSQFHRAQRYGKGVVVCEDNDDDDCFYLSRGVPRSRDRDDDDDDRWDD